jgi:hypothetical protein
VCLCVFLGGVLQADAFTADRTLLWGRGGGVTRVERAGGPWHGVGLVVGGGQREVNSKKHAKVERSWVAPLRHAR